MAIEISSHRQLREATKQHHDRAFPESSTIQTESLRLPPGYQLDSSDPDILFLRTSDGHPAAAFSARGASREGIEEAAWEAHRSCEDGG